LTAAHKSLPFGTVVEVRNLDNGRAVQVRINDRGPFVRKRVIDLTRTAAQALDMLGPGTARVELYLVEEAPPGRPYTVQVGAFLDPERARSLQAELALRYSAVALHSDGTWYRVQVSRFRQRREAESVRRELARLGYAAVVVRAAEEG
jgi:rare lipoprotein A